MRYNKRTICNLVIVSSTLLILLMGKTSQENIFSFLHKNLTVWIKNCTTTFHNAKVYIYKGLYP